MLTLAFRIKPFTSLCVLLHCTTVILALTLGISWALSIPSSNAFLFSLAPFNANDGAKRLKVLPERRHQAIRSHNQKGPCWGKDKDELCFNNQQVNIEINVAGVYDVNGISNTSTYFTGGSSFLADDVEVFTIAGKNAHYLLYYSRLQCMLRRIHFHVEGVSDILILPQSILLGEMKYP